MTNDEAQTETPRSYFLVCGLGSLGQYCVAKLKEFGVSVTAIDIALPSIWEVNNIPDLLEELALGDCRQPDVLAKAKIQQCQTVFIVTSDERVNIDTAFAVIVLNQHVRIVIRSSKQNLNELLDRSLGNFTALEATQITASAFAIAALGSEIQGSIDLLWLLPLLPCPSVIGLCAEQTPNTHSTKKFT
ncbi:NAD-binding protein [Scytonema sp. NUACC26]|uniref:NAD-binding protein n=1 Tax=Scytonema sp. NUACC26 TaxID=3140176 RepID=UPI0034DC21B6